MSYQRNDIYISVTDSSGLDIVNALDIVYVLFTKDKSRDLVTKKLGDGITVKKIDDVDTVVINIPANEAIFPEEVLWEELKIKTVNADVFTVHQGKRRFNKTHITIL